MRILIDLREPDLHPWLPYLPAGWDYERATLETGDLALAAMSEAAVIERKSPSDGWLHRRKPGTLRKGTKARAICRPHGRRC